MSFWILHTSHLISNCKLHIFSHVFLFFQLEWVFHVFIHCDYVFPSKAIIITEDVLVVHDIYNYENMILL